MDLNAGQNQVDHSHLEQDGYSRATGVDTAKNRRQSSVAEENQGADLVNGHGFAEVGFGNSGDSNVQYKHWNVFFKDIFRVSIDIVDRETNKVIS